MRSPDFEGSAGRAWRVTAEMGPALVAGYLVHAPGSHHLWPWHMVTCIHLRPMEGVPDPKLHVPDATHEYVVVAIDPEQCPYPDPDDIEEIRFLRPVDVVQQVTGLDDKQAAKVLELCALACTSGRLVPDVDFHRAWEHAIVATADHQRGEHHH